MGLIAPAGEALKRTALNATHRASGAKMVDYCGWDMPVEYSGITREHLGRAHGRRALRRKPHGGD